MTYREFLESKIDLATDSGFAVDRSKINPEDVVYDPFGGLMTVPMTAVKMGRYGKGCELNPDYFRDGVGYLQAAENEMDELTLFDFMPGVME